jgi:hypothetical protein
VTQVRPEERREDIGDGEQRFSERESDDSEFFPFMYNTVSSILTNPTSKEPEMIIESIAVVNSSERSLSDDEFH